MTKFMNKSFTVGPRGFEKSMTDTEWEIATGSRCPKCTSKFREGTTDCLNSLCGENALANQLAEAAPVCEEDEIDDYGASGAYELFETCKDCGKEQRHCEAYMNVRPHAVTTSKGYFDGGSSSNPGLGASAWWLEYEDGTDMTGFHGLGVTTNNRAEYDGLIRLLEYALAHGVKRIRVHGDSQLIVNQTLGKWKVKDADLKPLAEEAKRLAAQFEEFHLEWIPREQNGVCDALVKTTIKEQKQ